MNGRGSGLSGEQIEFLLLLSRTHSLTRTASALGLSVATVSRMLGAVREIFDDELFVRSGNSMAPTRRMTALVPKLERARAVIEALRPVGRGARSRPKTAEGMPEVRR